MQIIDSCLECIPQLILSIYVIRLEMMQNCETSLFQYFKLIASWATLTINFAFYPYDVRSADRFYCSDLEFKTYHFVL